MIAWLPRAFVAIVIVVVAAAIANAVKDIISGALGGLSYGRVLATIASVFILGLGVIAALNQIGVATAVTTPVLIAVLATVGGILVVGVGGGLIRPMQSRWESWLTRRRAGVAADRHARPRLPGRTPRHRGRAAAATATNGDADATQVATRPADPEATQVVPGPRRRRPTQVVTPGRLRRHPGGRAAPRRRRRRRPGPPRPTTRPGGQRLADSDVTQVVGTGATPTPPR